MDNQPEKCSIPCPLDLQGPCMHAWHGMLCLAYSICREFKECHTLFLSIATINNTISTHGYSCGHNESLRLRHRESSPTTGSEMSMCVFTRCCIDACVELWLKLSWAKFMYHLRKSLVVFLKRKRLPFWCTCSHATYVVNSCPMTLFSTTIFPNAVKGYPSANENFSKAEIITKSKIPHSWLHHLTSLSGAGSGIWKMSQAYTQQQFLGCAKWFGSATAGSTSGFHFINRVSFTFLPTHPSTLPPTDRQTNFQD